MVLEQRERERKTTVDNVSVPSTGRMVLELRCLAPMSSSTTSFSTLYGSNGVGTTVGNVISAIPGLFQYPLRVEWCWNLLLSPPNTSPIVFQYPLRVEWCWNNGFIESFERSPECFSTLYGSNGVGTLDIHTEP